MIPLSEPYLSGNEWMYIKECLDTNWVSSVGSFVNQFEVAIAEYTKTPFSVATNSGTSALHLALKIAGIEAKQLVVMPNLTFVATANAVSYHGASPLLIDSEPSGWQMDLDLLEDFFENHCSKEEGLCIHRASKRKIGAILNVHILGYVCDMDRLSKIAKAWNLPLIEDATESLGSTFAQQHAGTIGDLGCLSFNGNKIITTGGGGMFLTSNETWAQRAKHLSTQAKAPGLDYFHDEIGYNFRLVNPLAAIGLAQMEKFPYILKQKQQIANTYQKELSKHTFPVPHPKVSPNFWLNTLLVPNKEGLIIHLAKQNIQSRPLWIPMHQLPMYKDCIYYTKNNVSKYLYQHAVSIPSSASLSSSDQEKVIAEILDFH